MLPPSRRCPPRPLSAPRVPWLSRAQSEGGHCGLLLVPVPLSSTAGLSCLWLWHFPSPRAHLQWGLPLRIVGHLRTGGVTSGALVPSCCMLCPSRPALCDAGHFTPGVFHGGYFFPSIHAFSTCPPHPSHVNLPPLPKSLSETSAMSSKAAVRCPRPLGPPPSAAAVSDAPRASGFRGPLLLPTHPCGLRRGRSCPGPVGPPRSRDRASGPSPSVPLDS